MKNKNFKAFLYPGILLIIIGLVSILLENIFYQYLDAEGVLHESLFLPLGGLSILIGLISFAVYALSRLITYFQGLYTAHQSKK